jgi:hypothetical protein
MGGLMRWLRHRARKAAIGRPLAGLLLLGLFVSVMGMATSSELHQALHPNASNPNHHCVVTLLTSGQVEASAGTAAPIALDSFLVSSVFYSPSFQADFSFNHSLSRGPPALLS